uniref:Uncharacterized protein n=1 Tax=Anguilla anguilla TaxID=7936 RepID=A0A0E9XLG8_ANGAN
MFLNQFLSVGLI